MQPGIRALQAWPVAVDDEALSHGDAPDPAAEPQPVAMPMIPRRAAAPSGAAVAATMAQAPEPPTVIIEIGSIELRTPPAEPAASAPAPAPRRTAALSLDAYLDRRASR